MRPAHFSSVDSATWFLPRYFATMEEKYQRSAAGKPTLFDDQVAGAAMDIAAWPMDSYWCTGARSALWATSTKRRAVY